MGAVLTKERFARSKALIAGMLAGIAAPATLGLSADYPRPMKDDMSRLRGDARRLADTFRVVIDGERAALISKEVRA